MDNKAETNEAYANGHRYGRRDGRYARMVGRMPFVGVSTVEARTFSRANSHAETSRTHRAYWLGYARGLTA
jgi:hypothetical protein